MPEIEQSVATEPATKKLKKILSLSDGTSGWQSIAKARDHEPGTDYEAYVSEIDPYAIRFTMTNYPLTKQLGDMRDVSGEGYDAIIGGTPCINLSSLGKREGLKDRTTGEILDTPEKYFEARDAGHDVTPSSLVYEYKRILDEARKSGTEPKFMLENVASMSNRWKNHISDLMGVEPIRSRSRGIQPRKRYFWTNIMDQKEYDDAVYSKPKTYVKDLLNFDAPRRKAPLQYLVVSTDGYNLPTVAATGSFDRTGMLVAGPGDEIPTLSTRSTSRVLDRNGTQWIMTPDDYIRMHLEGIGDPSEISDAGLSVTRLAKLLGNGWSHADVAPLIDGLF